MVPRLRLLLPLAALAAVSACSNATEHDDAAPSAPTATREAGPDTSTPRAAARQFSVALAQGHTDRACHLATPQLSASVPGGDCPTALHDLATDSRWVFTQADCVRKNSSYRADGDPRDTARSKRIDIKCPQGYTWLRVEESAGVWRVAEFNAP